jgi:hypothetical protein
MRGGPPINPPDPGPIATHDHEFRPVDDSPIFEDGAAIFREECEWREVHGSYTSDEYDETFYDEGAKCSESRYYRMEEAWIELRRDDAPDIRYLDTESDGRFWRIGEMAEMAVVTDDSAEIVSIDPDEEHGEVVVETDDWRIRYEANNE